VTHAFDTVWHKGLYYKLAKTSPPSYLYAMIVSYLKDRTFQARINATLSAKQTMNFGLPQGAVLSPLLYLLYTHDIPETVMTATFADDTLLISQEDNINEAVSHLQDAANTITAWFVKWRLALNPTKTEAKIFSLRSQRDQNIAPITINGQNITWRAPNEPVRYLGLLLDTRLTWRPHIYRTLQKANSQFRKLYPILNKNTPLKYNCISLIYKSLLRPILTYGCQVWYGASSIHTNKLDSFQNKTLRSALNVPWFVRNDQIRYELEIPSLREHIEKIIVSHHAKLPSVEGAVHCNLGQRCTFRLKPRTYQDKMNI